MAGLLKRQPKGVEPFERFDWVDRPFDELLRLLSLRRPVTLTHDWMPADVIQVDEYHEDGMLVIQAELPGIDPEQDVTLTVVEGMLNIEAERREEAETEERGYIRKELRYGSFARTLRLPEGVDDAKITATYRDGMLEVRIPAPESVTPRQIDITTA
jgi:HSP20 family protein